MFSVGLTGGIGSGKSTVARVFGVLGVPVFQADVESKQALQDDPTVKQAVIDAFGSQMYPAGRLDRKALAAVVFNDHEALATLNGIAHPAVRARFAQWAAARKAPYGLVEAALLVDTGWYRELDHLVVVSAPDPERVQRVMARDGATEAEVQARMRNQVSEQERLNAAHSVIMNDGHLRVIPQVLSTHALLMAKARV